MQEEQEPVTNGAAHTRLERTRRERAYSLSCVEPLKRSVRCLGLSRTLKSTDRDKELWIGLAHIKQTQRNGTLDDADEAFVNVIGLALGKADFRSQIKEALDPLNLILVRLKDVELMAERLKKHTIHEDLHAIAEEVQSSGTLGFDVFATFDANLIPLQQIVICVTAIIWGRHRTSAWKRTRSNSSFIFSNLGEPFKRISVMLLLQLRERA